VENSALTILPCRKCGAYDPVFWEGKGTQADLCCKECGEEENIQVTDILTYEERYSGNADFNHNTLKYPQWVIDKVNEELVKEWNARYTPTPTKTNEPKGEVE
jgi:hypothetical protein